METYKKEGMVGGRGEKEEENLYTEFIMRNNGALLVLRFLGTGEQSASTEKLTGLSSEVLLSLAGWFRSFGKRERTGKVLKHLHPQQTSAADQVSTYHRINQLVI